MDPAKRQARLTRLDRRNRRRQRQERLAARKAAEAAEAMATAPPAPLSTVTAVLSPSGPANPPFVTGDGQRVHLIPASRGTSIFLLLSGPSLAALDLRLLYRRGIVTFGVNNSPTVGIRTNYWTYVDRQNKFHDAIWKDPACIKFAVSRQLHKSLREKRPDGTFRTITDGNGKDLAVRDMPSTLGYVRNAWFDPEKWLTEDSINWGNSKKSAAKNGHPNNLNVMFASLKICYSLEFRTVYLLGCDFHMHVERPYAFAQTKDAGGCNSNNGTYRTLNQMLGLLRPKFDAAGFRVLNCNPDSGLRVFDFISYREAVERATAGIPQDPLDASGWYDVN